MKYIFVDSGSLTHQAIFSWSAQKTRQVEQKLGADSFILPSSYTYFMMLISLLKRVGINKDDVILICSDGKNSWRKGFDKNYKAQREAFRKSYEFIDWQFHYSGINKVIKQIEESTDFHIIWMSSIYNYLDLLNTPEGEKYLNLEEIDSLEKEFGLEADDLIAVGVKNFSKDNECIIISKDADLEQLCVYPNTKFFSMNIKYKGGTGVYKPVDNGYKILEKKIRLGDKSDNIIVPEEDTEKDKEIRKLIIDLINLPIWVENPIKNILERLPKKEYHFSNLPFPKSLALRFPDIYCSKNIITYEDSIKRVERKEVRIKNKKIKLKKEKTLRKLTKE
jgi:hypothetical protein